MGNTFACFGIRSVRPFDSVVWVETEPCTRRPTSKIFSKYSRAIEDIKKTTDGIVFLYHDALKYTGTERLDEFTLMLQSLGERLKDLRISLLSISKLSAYNVDNSVRQRQGIAREMFFRIEDFQTVIRFVNERKALALVDVRHEIETLVQFTNSLCSL